MENIREECYGADQPGRADHDLIEFYNEERLGKPIALRDAAKNTLGPGDDRYRERVTFANPVSRLRDLPELL